MADYTIDAIISRVKRAFAASNNDPNFSDNNVLAYLNDELVATIAPILSRLSEEYFIEFADLPIDGTTDHFSIPKRALVSGLRDVNLIKLDTTGLETRASIREVPHISSDRIQDYSCGMYIQGDKVVLVGVKDLTDYTMRIYYNRRPNELVLSTSARQVSTKTSTDFTISSLPSGWTSLVTYALIENNPPFKILADDLACTVSGTTITPSSMPATLAVGDWIALAGQSPISQIPFEAFSLFSQAAVVRIAEALDPGALKIAVPRFAQMLDNLTSVMSNRIALEPVRMIQRDSFFRYF